jgi:DNA-binding PadR family transcriptional regulator
MTTALLGALDDIRDTQSVNQSPNRIRGRRRCKVGTLYPALVRLEDRGYIKGPWRKTQTGHDAKFYGITRTRALEGETAGWRRLVGFIDKLLVRSS